MAFVVQLQEVKLFSVGYQQLVGSLLDVDIACDVQVIILLPPLYFCVLVPCQLQELNALGAPRNQRRVVEQIDLAHILFSDFVQVEIL